MARPTPPRRHAQAGRVLKRKAVQQHRARGDCRLRGIGVRKEVVKKVHSVVID